MGLSRMTTRTWMAVVAYAALDLAAHQGAFAWGSIVGAYKRSRTMSRSGQLIQKLALPYW